MGQKTHPTAVRLGLVKKWDLQYLGEKKNELAALTTKNIAFKELIVKLFSDNGLSVHDIKINYNVDALNIFIKYFFNTKPTKWFINSRNTLKIKYKKTFDWRPKSRKFLLKALRLEDKNRNKLLRNIRRKYVRTIFRRVRFKQLIYRSAGLIDRASFAKKPRVPAVLTRYKRYLIVKKFSYKRNVDNNLFIRKLLENLNMFLGDIEVKIHLTIVQINKDLKPAITGMEKPRSINKNLVTLRKFNKSDFFHEGVNIIFSATLLRNPADMIAQFISSKIPKQKRHKFLLAFVKASLTKFIRNGYSKIKGAKIVIKGRFNGAPRARTKSIKVGRGVSVLTLKSKVDYSEKTAYTSNGTFGVKVWVRL